MDRKKAVYFLLALILFHTLVNVYITTNHKRPLTHDSARFLAKSLLTYDFLRKGEIKNALGAYAGDGTGDTRYSPLFIYLTQPFYFLFGKSVASAVAINNLFLGLLIISMFRLGKEIFSEKVGLLAAVLISFYPQVYGHSRVYMQDLALTAAICLDIFLLIRTKGFSERKASLLFGCALGLSQLIKMPVVIYMAGPLFAVFFVDFHCPFRDTKTKGRLANLVLALLISFLIYSPWFLHNYHQIADEDLIHPFFSFIPFNPFSGERHIYGPEYELWSLENVFFYPKTMLHYQLLFVFGSLFFIALASLVRWKQVDMRTKLIVVLFFLIPYLFFTFMMNGRDERYLLPFAVGVALVTAVFLVEMVPPKLSRGLLVLCAGIALFQFVALTYGAPIICRSGLMGSYFSFFGNTLPFMEWQEGVFSVSTDSFGSEELLAMLLADSGAQNGTVVGVSDFRITSPYPYLLLLKGVDDIKFEITGWMSRPMNPAPDYFVNIVKYGSCDSPYEMNDTRPMPASADYTYDLVGAVVANPCGGLCKATTAGSRTDLNGVRIELYRRMRR